MGRNRVSSDRTEVIVYDRDGMFMGLAIESIVIIRSLSRIIL